MKYRALGNTGIRVSEIGFGGEWLERHEESESVELLKYAGSKGVNIIDCWMPDPKSRDIIGKAIEGNRSNWVIQGHIGSTYQNGQYVRSRDLKFVKPAFEDILTRMKTDYIDLGMIHYVDTEAEWKEVVESDFIDYVKELKETGKIRHIGMSTHNARIGKIAVESGIVEMLMFSVNPAFDMMHPPIPADNQDEMFGEYDESFSGIDPERAELYRLCEEKGVGITVMKPFFGGNLFNPERSLFGVAFTPLQCIHYALTRPAVSAVMCGYDTKEQLDEALSYERASDSKKDYASVIAHAPKHAYTGLCTYCGHCQPCPMGIDIATVSKFYDLAMAQPTVPESVQQHYADLPATAASCISCHGCESRCPFDVKIAERMAKAAELFGC